MVPAECNLSAAARLLKEIARGCCRFIYSHLWMPLLLPAGTTLANCCCISTTTHSNYLDRTGFIVFQTHIIRNNLQRTAGQIYIRNIPQPDPRVAPEPSTISTQPKTHTTHISPREINHVQKLISKIRFPLTDLAPHQLFSCGDTPILRNMYIHSIDQNPRE